MSSFGSISPGNHIIHGWAFVEPSWSVPPCVYLEVSDDKTGVKEYFQAYRCHRPDVSDHFHRPTLTMSGFRALVPLGHRERGAFSIRVLQSDGQVFYGSDVSLRLAPVAQNYETIVRQGLARKFLSGCGIEIGALQRPLPVPEHCSVRYIDRMPVSELLQQYPELGDLPLQQPDLIDDGEKLSRIAAGSQDFVIANHFLEHCENPIHTLLNMFRIIRVGGVIFLAVPDKRYTFDFARPSTDYETLKTTAQSGIRPDKMALYEEWVRYVMHHDSATDAQVVKLVASKYSIHYNVWNADELITFLCRARTDFSLPFILASVVCSENEAILTLEKTSQ
ncbi:MAG: methyltransferase domain-containing protein [Acidobacteriia bacterium]|nr:methyltransferase domain-containing protein [Terriglobia bacterium]